MLLAGMLSTALDRRLRRLDQRPWLESAVLRTAFPFCWVCLSFVVAGSAFHWYAPEARSIGDVWQHDLCQHPPQGG